MKKIILAVLCLCLLCSCKDTRSVISENGRFLVSAIGVDMKENEVLLSVEAVVVNSQDSEQPPAPTVFESSDTTFNSAMENVTQKSAKPLDFSHCAMVVLGENLKEEVINDIYEFCLSNEQITVSVGFATTEFANKLLKLKPMSDLAVGYEMAVMLETGFTENGMVFNNRFYEIENARLKGQSPKSLPYFKIEEDSFYLLRYRG